MNQKQLKALIAAGVFSTALMAGTAYADESGTAPATPKKNAKHKEKQMRIKDANGKLVDHACAGQNACKGQGGCKGSAGENACKGQGGCAVHHGKPMHHHHEKAGAKTGAAATSDMKTNSMPAGQHSCKGKNSCKGQGGCKTGDNGCKSQNSCAGKGGCATDGSMK